MGQRQRNLGRAVEPQPVDAQAGELLRGLQRQLLHLGVVLVEQRGVGPLAVVDERVALPLEPVRPRRGPALRQHLLVRRKAAAGVREREVEQQPHPLPVRVLHEALERRPAAEQGVDGERVHQVVAVGAGRHLYWGQVERGDAEVAQLAQRAPDAFEVPSGALVCERPDPARAVGSWTEAVHEDGVKHRVAPPLRHSFRGQSRRRRSQREVLGAGLRPHRAPVGERKAEQRRDDGQPSLVDAMLGLLVRQRHLRAALEAHAVAGAAWGILVPAHGQGVAVRPTAQRGGDRHPAAVLEAQERRCRREQQRFGSAVDDQDRVLVPFDAGAGARVGFVQRPLAVDLELVGPDARAQLERDAVGADRDAVDPVRQLSEEPDLGLWVEALRTAEEDDAQGFGDTGNS
ncbi:MAG: hypothetical protein QM765_42830 [Myxococcales bacterium]